MGSISSRKNEIRIGNLQVKEFKQFIFILFSIKRAHTIEDHSLILCFFAFSFACFGRLLALLISALSARIVYQSYFLLIKGIFGYLMTFGR